MENKNENINLEESSSSSSEEEKMDDFDIDNERLTLIDVSKRIFEKRARNAKKSLLLQNKRKPPTNIIVYDSSAKQIRNVFSPSKEELQDFLENCKIKEIDPSEFEQRIEIDRNIFCPNEYMKRNNIAKSYISMEDLFQDNNNEDKDDNKEEILPLINPKFSFNSSKFPKDEERLQSQDKSNDDKKNLEDILNTDVLGPSQKDWLNTYIKKISGMNVDSVIINGKKLQIIFDLDNTLIFNFINTHDEKVHDEIVEKNQDKDVNPFRFEHNEKVMYSSFITRQGLEEFINYTKLFCIYHINTLASEKYAEKIIEKLEEKLNIKFDKKVMRKEYKNTKSIKEFDCKYIKSCNSVIFDDNVTKWKDSDLGNVIPSKRFFDKEHGINCIKNNKETDNTENNLTCLLNSFGNFFYYTFQKNNLGWSEQSLKKLPNCPFYHYKERDDEFYFDVYNGEYFESNRKQFIFMRNVIKVIYYMLYHDKVPISESIKLIRLNVFYGKYFYLKYVDKAKIAVLFNIIKTCGGEIVEPDESLSSKMKKIIMVCSFNIYENEKIKIQKEAKDNNCVVVNEKFVLDCFYFMTFIEADYLDGEYEPKFCDEYKGLFFK